MGKLPVKYLGVPLITKQISLSECKPLIERVKHRELEKQGIILCWENATNSLSIVFNVSLLGLCFLVTERSY